MRYAGRTALVTGAGSGIGRAAALRLAREGATVHCADIDLAGAHETAQEISGRAFFLDGAVESGWREALDRIPDVDVVVHSAGVSHAAPVWEMPLDDWRRVLAINLDGTLLALKHAIPVMRAHGRPSAIVAVSSVSGRKPAPGASAYCASKAAVSMLCRTAALECLRNGDRIRINTVAPSGVKTAMWKTMPFFEELIAKHGSEEAAYAAMSAGSPAGTRFAEPEEIAAAIAWLASAEASFVNATEFVIDNGDSG